MKQIKFLDYKCDNNKLVLYLGDKKNVCVWTIPTSTPIQGHVNKSFPLLRRSLYDLAYYITTDRDKRNVIMDAVWYILQYPRTRTVWVRDTFLDELNKQELINVNKLQSKLFDLLRDYFSNIQCKQCKHYYDTYFIPYNCNKCKLDEHINFWIISDEYAHKLVDDIMDCVSSEIYEDKCVIHDERE